MLNRALHASRVGSVDIIRQKDGPKLVYRAPRTACCAVRAGGGRNAAPSNSQQQQTQQQQGKQPQTVVAVDPTAPTVPIKEARGPPVAVLALAAVAAAAVGAVAFKRLRRGAGAYGDPFEREVLRNVNLVRVDELSEEAIAVARARRQRESAYLKMDLQEVELPDNHPWAVKKPVTEEQEAEIAARLSVRRAARRGLE